MLQIKPMIFALATLLAYSSPWLAGAEGIDLSDLERAAQGNGEDAARWSRRRERMRSDFAKVKALAERLTAEQRSQAWQRFLAAYSDKDPFDNSDEELCRLAREAIAGGNLALVASPAEKHVDPAVIAAATMAYDRAKRTDLLPGPAEEKRSTWAQFLRAHGADPIGVREVDDMRGWAHRRIDALASTPPVQLLMSPVVNPGFDLGQGTRIAALQAHGLAERFGLRVGDTIIAAGQPPHDLVDNQGALRVYVASLNRESDLRLVVIRGNAVIAVPAATAPPHARGPVPARSAVLGLRCLESTGCLMVGSVEPGAFGECAGFDAGDRIVAVRGVPIATLVAMETAISNLAADEPLELDILRAGECYRLAVPADGSSVLWTSIQVDSGWEPARQVAAATSDPSLAEGELGKTTTAVSTQRVDIELGALTGAHDLQVRSVAASGLAERLGVKAGDVVVAAGDPPRAIATSEELKAYLHECTDSTVVRLVVRRPAQGTVTSVIPLPPAPAGRSSRCASPPLAGPDGRRSLGIVLLGESPVTVVAVRPGSVAEAIGLVAGDTIEMIDGKAMHNVAAMKSEIDRLDLAGRFVFQVRTSTNQIWTVAVAAQGGPARWQQWLVPQP